MKYFIVLVIFSLSFAHAQPFSEAVEKWTMPVKVDTNAWYPYVTPDGNKLFFMGYNGYNYIEKTETGWSERTRLGNQINFTNFLRKSFSLLMKRLSILQPHRISGFTEVSG